MRMNDMTQQLVLREIGNGIDSAIDEVYAQRTLKERAGHPMWDTLHYIAKVADDEGNPNLYLSLLEIYLKGHPCSEECRPHLNANIRTINPHNYLSMFEHSVDLHNLVNRQLNKKHFSMLQANNKYDLDCDTCIFTPSGKSHSTSVQQQNHEQSYNGSARHNSRARNTHSTRVYPLRGGTQANL